MRTIGTHLCRWFTGALLLLGALVTLVTFSPLTRWWAGILADDWRPPERDTLIVLGGDTLGDDILGRSSYWRAIFAVAAWRNGGVRRILISGGPDGPNRPVAELIKEFMVCAGVPASVVETEVTSLSTRQNALSVADRLRTEPGRITLLTSDYHMFRARRAFRKAGLEVYPWPAPDALKLSGRWAERWPVFLQLVQETTKIGYYLFRGWM